MHELSIAQELLDIIYVNAEEAGIRSVSEVNLRIGEYAGIFPDSLQFAFEVLSQDKMTEGASLNIEHVAPRYVCKKCQTELKRGEDHCTRCGSEDIRMIGGDELELVSFEGE